MLVLSELRYAYADLKLHLASLDLLSAINERARVYELRYRPDQPRAPSGTPEGGQWVYAGADSEEVQRVAQVVDTITKHGIDQIINRGISPAAIVDAIQNPLKIRPRPNGTTQYIGQDATVVLNALGGLVTIWPQ